VEEVTPQAQVEEVELKIQAKIKHKVKGMTSLKFIVIIAKVWALNKWI